MDDLVQRLRALSRYAHDDKSIGDEAADELERLRAELGVLRASTTSVQAESTRSNRPIARVAPHRDDGTR
jgi:hypothetical protein